MKIKDKEYINIRNRIVGFIDNTLIGPMNGPNEILDVSPMNFYTTGILYPRKEISSPEKNFEEKANLEDENVEGTEESLNKIKLQVNGDQMNTRNLRKKTFDETSKEYDSCVNDELAMTSEFKPSAFGISVITDLVSSFSISVQAGKYDKIESDNKLTKYKRVEINYDFQLRLTKNELSLINGDRIICGKNRVSYKIHDLLEFNVTIRKFSKKIFDKYVVTLTLIHIGSTIEYKNDASTYYFQPKIKAYSNEPVFLPNEDMSKINSLSFDELNNNMLYSKYLSFGVGHGSSVTWNDMYNYNEKKKKWVKSEIIPRYEVLSNEFEPEELIKRNLKGEIIRDCEILYIKRLSGESFISKQFDETPVQKENMIKELNDFVNIYKVWVDSLNPDTKTCIHKEFEKPAKKNISICEKLIERMRKGIELISEDPKVYKSFTDANKAMFIQRMMSGFTKKRIREFGDLFPGENDEPLPNFPEDFKYNINDEYFSAKWRPFQLAFLLSQLEGIVYPESEDRDTTDLIWFTTGGGKTEAYLALTAFTIFYRRLRENNPDKGAGVSVIMRYTLRLLNKQQFNRSLPLICSCELIRRNEPQNYGNKEISVGIWVGSSLTPNNWKLFQECFNKLKIDPTADVEYTLPIITCPCCGTKLIKTSKNKGQWGCIGTRERGKEKYPYYLTCRNHKCDFYISDQDRDKGNFVKHLPVYFVDEEIYKTNILPTLLFSTVDKFASLPWRKESFNLFNISVDNSNEGVTNLYPGPELIIQDELHLISSALGTIYGIYEAAIDKLCSNSGYKPKIVAATATVRNAEMQCRFLFARKFYSQFPPFGLDADDSFYSRKQLKYDTIKQIENWGRLYLGFQPSGNTNTVAQIRLISLLMQLIPTIPEKNSLMDFYYPIVVYFNTLKELGKFRTLLEDDIVAYRNFLSKKFGNYFIPFAPDRCNELSSAMNADDITLSLEILEKNKLKNLNDDDLAQLLFSKGIRQSSDIKYLSFDKGEGKNNFMRLFNNLDTFNKLGLEYDISDENKNFDNFVSKIRNILGDEDSYNVSNIVSATNMISVGIDIPRFNVMQITGQPKSHSEYIQASSRVSREKPGLVITTANPSKNRDRSHYERFVDYHQTFYKYVESTSVTPFSLPALEKVLPAVMISLMQVFSFKLKRDANLNLDTKYKSDYCEIKNSITKRIKFLCDNSNEINDQERDVYISYFNSVSDKIFKQWEKLSDDIKSLTFSGYEDYFYKGKEGNPDVNKINNALFVQPQFKDIELSWINKLTCMNSMRTVENSSLIKIK